MVRWLSPAATMFTAFVYWSVVAYQENVSPNKHEPPPEIVVSGAAQILLYGGDRFLAANIESVRAAAAVTSSDAQDFRLRAHKGVSRLNPCHEDNYWIGNASLSWGGLEKHGFDLLFNAMNCRYWDEWPAFFYGFNQYFFRNNISEARIAIERAATRSSQNAESFRTFSIMLEAGKVKNTQMALEMLKHERGEAKKPKLREMLSQRVTRLQGLLTLLESQKNFESKFGRPLRQPQELLETGLLDEFPEDPLNLGYEFRENTFHLRQMKIQ